MAAGADDGRDVDSAGVYFMTVEEFESRAEPDREPEPDAAGDAAAGEPVDRPDTACRGRERTRSADRRSAKAD